MDILFKLKAYLYNEHWYHSDKWINFMLDYLYEDKPQTLSKITKEREYVDKNKYFLDKLQDDNINTLKNDILTHIDNEHMYHTDAMYQEVRDLYKDLKKPYNDYFDERKFIEYNRNIYNLIANDYA